MDLRFTAGPAKHREGLRAQVDERNEANVAGDANPKTCRLDEILRLLMNLNVIVQGGWGGWPTGNGKKVSISQAQLGQATCLAVAHFLSISCGPSTPSSL